MEKKEKENIIKIEVKALSNLFIGGTPRPFEIGGIDQWTAVDEYGFPCIPASSLKGALRAIVAEDRSPVALEIAQWYEEMLKAEMTQIREKFKGNAEMVDRIERRYQEVLKQSSAVYLFGIREFNNTPKLLFNDLRLKKEYQDLDSCFSIDTKTERLMQEGINQMLKGRTSFIIAHRLSTIKNCDRIMYIDDGRIVESGSHEELMERKGEYYKLYTAQLQEMSLPA